MKQVTSGSAWRKPELVTLPSGNTAELKRPDMLALLADDDVPDFVRGSVLGNINKGPMAEPATLSLDASQLSKLRAFFHKICRQCFVNPRIVDDPQADDEIAISDLTLRDASEVVTWAMGGGVAAAQRFPKEPVAGMGIAPNGNRIPQATVATGADQ